MFSRVSTFLRPVFVVLFWGRGTVCFRSALDVLSVSGAAMIGDCLVWCCNTFRGVKLSYICPVPSTERTELRLTYIPPPYGAHLCASLFMSVR